MDHPEFKRKNTIFRVRNFLPWPNLLGFISRLCHTLTVKDISSQNVIFISLHQYIRSIMYTAVSFLAILPKDANNYIINPIIIQCIKTVIGYD